MNTIYFSKRFLSGTLKGLTVHQSVTGSPRTLASFVKGHTGRDAVTRAKFVIVDASYQNYVRN